MMDNPGDVSEAACSGSTGFQKIETAQVNLNLEMRLIQL